MGYVFLVLGILALGAAAFFTITPLRDYHRDRHSKAISKPLLTKLGIALGCYMGAGLFLQIAIALLAQWDFWNGYGAMGIIGAALFVPSFALLWICFFVRFARPDTEPKQLKIIKI